MSQTCGTAKSEPDSKDEQIRNSLIRECGGRGTMTMQQWFEMVANGDGTVTINGHPVQAEAGDPFTAAIRFFQTQAGNRGSAVLVRSADASTGLTSWFQVTGDGQVVPAQEPESGFLAPLPEEASKPAGPDAGQAPVPEVVEPTAPEASGEAAKPEAEEREPSGEGLASPWARLAAGSVKDAKPVISPARNSEAAVEWGPSTPASTTAGAESAGPRRAVPISEAGSFLASAGVRPGPRRATSGWKGRMNAAFGTSFAASSEEEQLAEDWRLLSQRWPKFKTVAVVNRKGGANKTPTVAMLAAAFARAAGGGVAAWDNNESQGTLGWRTENAGHGASVLDVVADAQRLVNAYSPSIMASYTHHQSEDLYDVIRSDEDEQGDHEVTAGDVTIAHKVLSRFYRMVVMDSGNTARSQNWKRMIELADQLVVPMTATEDRAEAARLTLTTLHERGGHSQELAMNSVAIVSEATDTGSASRETREDAQRIAEAIRPFVREVHVIPFDPAMRAGHLRWDALRPATRDAWVRAAAAVARGF